MNVTAWLQSLGLERCGPLFGDDGIDREVLPKLTSEDLKEIGVLAIGHRRKLLDASPRLALRFRPQPWRQLSSRARLVRVSRAEAPLDTPPLAAHQIMEKLWDINVKGFHRRDGITVDAM